MLRLLPSLLLFCILTVQAGEGMLIHHSFAEFDALRESWKKGDPTPFAKDIVTHADAALKKPIPLITEKAQLPASKDPHDYYSIGIYWWKNPITPTGLPYIQKDGVYNPESEKFDRPKIEAFARDSWYLSAAYYITGDKKYADAARKYFRTWFINADTRMNPNLQHAQSWPGWNNGTPTGILEGVIFADSAPDAVTIMKQSGALPDDEYQIIRKWFADLAKWMEESENGKTISEAIHNHGSWYDMQRTCYFLFLGDTDHAKEILSKVGEKRIAPQIMADGSQPAELKRTKSYDYSIYNLSAILKLCDMGDKVGVDIWSYKSKDGGSVPVALEFLVPYALGEKPWPYKQILKMYPSQTANLLKQAAPHYPDKKYAEIADQIMAKQK